MRACMHDCVHACSPVGVLMVVRVCRLCGGGGGRGGGGGGGARQRGNDVSLRTGFMRGGHPAPCSRRGRPFAAGGVSGASRRDCSAATGTAALGPAGHTRPPAPQVDVQLQLDPARHSVVVRALARTDAKTGVEMEALAAVAVAALTVYDMCKAVAKDIAIGEIQLDFKEGGRTGRYVRPGLRPGDMLASSSSAAAAAAEGAAEGGRS